MVWFDLQKPPQTGSRQVRPAQPVAVQPAQRMQQSYLLLGILLGADRILQSSGHLVVRCGLLGQLLHVSEHILPVAVVAERPAQRGESPVLVAELLVVDLGHPA